MRKTTAAAAARAMGAQMVSGPMDKIISGVTIDSRQIEPGDLFVAFPGEKVDGHDYIAAAVRQGAAAVLLSRHVRDEIGSDVAVLSTTNPLQAIQTLAHAERSTFPGPVVAVTGSNGKTTTKEMLRQVFSTNGPCLATEKNFNNELGLPLTLLKRREHHTSIVVEMGMRARGEIEALCEIAQPTTGVITNIGHSHLERLGSQEQIALAKTELVAALPKTGTAILYGEDEWLRKLAHKSPCPALWFGFNTHCDAFATDVRAEGFSTSFTAHVLGNHCKVEIPTLGQHNVLNALAALLAGAANGLDLATMAANLEGMTSSSGRLHRVAGREERIIIDDCYNASPSSMNASLQVLMEMANNRPTCAILGDMYELGSYEQEGHQLVGTMAAKVGVQTLIAVGPRAVNIAQGADDFLKKDRKASKEQPHTTQKTFHYTNKAELLQKLDEVIPKQAVVLVKASRGMQLEEIVTALTTSVEEDV